MARSHSLLVLTVVFAFLMAANLCAADKKPTKSPAKKPQAQEEDPFGSNENPTNPTAHNPFTPKPAANEPSLKKPPKPPVKETPWRAGAAEAKIEAALATLIQLDFNEAPLQDVIDFLKETKQIEIQLDKRVLEDVNITSDTPVTINVKGISLKSALRILLRRMQPELTYMIKDEVLLITTPEIASEEFVTKLYPVGDLTACRDEHDAPWDDYDALIDVITSTIKPTTWDTVGAPGSVQGNTFGTAKGLIVSQTAEVHEEIANLLAKIREIAKHNPNAGTPRRSKPAPPPPKNNNPAPTPPPTPTAANNATSNVSGAPPGGAVAKPEEKPADAAKPRSTPPAHGGGMF
jgi:hypothetical protein